MTTWERIKAILAGKGQVTAEDVVSRTGLDEDAALRVLAEGVERGFVALDEKTGTLSLVREPRPGRGGWRPGAGRKPGPPEFKKAVVSVRLSPRVAAWLRSQENQGQVVEAALKAHYGQIGEINA